RDPSGVGDVADEIRWWRAFGAYHRLPYATPPA
ncbi:MAG: hypothetical protein QOJ98_2594, partial [Acidobacteriota bacterium]|nr:hypothetical protein [Acidobacteriota bacterium]